MQHQIPRSFSKHDNQQWFRQNKPLAIIAAFVATVVFVLIVKSFLSSPPAVPKENVYQTTSEEIQARERIDPSYYQEPLSWRPRVFRIKNLLSAGECDRLIQMSMGRLTKAEVYNPATSNSATSMASRTIFTGMKTFLRSDETVWLDGRIAQLLHLPYEYGEDFVVRKLSVGDAELKHVDYYAPGESAEVDKMLNRHGNRYATLIMYLNDDYTGGELKFSQAVQPFQIPKMNKGDALLYFNTDTNARLDPLTEHEASPIITGTKWIAVKWLRQKKWKLSEEEIARLNE